LAGHGSESLRTLLSLRGQAAHEVQRELGLREQELEAQRRTHAAMCQRRRALEARLTELRERFAEARALHDLQWLELELALAARAVADALPPEQRALRQVAEAERRVRDAEAILREQLLAGRALSHVIEGEQRSLERHAEQRAEDERDDLFRRRRR
jgi:hypothetical protein